MSHLTKIVGDQVLLPTVFTPDDHDALHVGNTVDLTVCIRQQNGREGGQNITTGTKVTVALQID